MVPFPRTPHSIARQARGWIWTVINSNNISSVFIKWTAVNDINGILVHGIYLYETYLSIIFEVCDNSHLPISLHEF